MAYCKRCGAKKWVVELDKNGLCEQCIRDKREIEEQRKRDDVLTKNYDVFRQGTAKTNAQRIFDAFVAKYPDAQITGVSVRDGGTKLLVHLDGNPMYYVTYNPLTNSIDLSSYQEVSAKAAAASEEEKRKAAEAESAKERGRNAGCSIFVSLLGVLYGVFCLMFSYVGGLVGIFFSLVVLAGGIAKSRAIVIFGGVLSLAALVFGFPFTILYLFFGIFYICFGTEM